jgi:hypothetical protein
VRARDWLLGVLVALAAVIAGLALTGSDDRPPDEAAGFVRSSASAYLHISSDTGGEQWQRARDLTRELPALEVLRNDLLVPQIRGALGELDLDRDVRPWLGGEAALAYVPVGAEQPQQLVLLSTKNEQASRRGLARAGFRPAGRHRGAQLLSAGRRVASVDDGFVVLGSDVQVRRALDVHAGATPALADDKTYRRLRDDLPDERLAHAYVARELLQTTFAGPAALLAGAARAPALKTGVFGISLGEKRGRLSFRGLTSSGSEPGGECEPEVEQGSSLLGKAAAEPAAVLGLSRVECLIREVIEAPGESRTGRTLRDFLAGVQRTDGVNLQRELLPLLQGETELIVSPGNPAPVITLVIDGVDERKALAVLGRLQPAILRLLRPQRLGRAASFEATRVDGVTALTVDLSPGLEVSYAVFDEKLVASTSLKGIEAAREEKGPDESDDFDLVLGDRPDEPSAVLFLDLDKLLALADQVGLGGNPAYLAVRDDLQKLGAIGAFISREEEDIDAELLFKNP